MWKVGFSTNPTQRRYTLSWTFRQKMTLDRTWEHDSARFVERKAHESLAAYRVEDPANGEVYNASRDVIVSAIEKAIEIAGAPRVPYVPPEPPRAQLVHNWMKDLMDWRAIRRERIAAIEAAIGRATTRNEREAWVKAGGMTDIPMPIFPEPKRRPSADALPDDGGSAAFEEAVEQIIEMIEPPTPEESE